jgi:hypothetical protein
MPHHADVSILMGMTDRQIREAIARDDAHGRAVLAAMLHEREGNAPSPTGGFRYSKTSQLKGEMLLCRREPAEHIKVMEGDEHEGWGGCLCRIPRTGEILLTDFRGNLCRSSDGGRTWSDSVRVEIPGPLYQDAPVQKRCIGAIGALRDGTILLACMVYTSPRRGPEDEGGYVTRSTDGGRTWEEPFRLDMLGYPHLEPASHLRFVELQDGTILLPAAAGRRGPQGRFIYPDGTPFPPSGEPLRAGVQCEDQYVFRSRDGGRTWGDPSLVTGWGCETNLVQLASGKIIAAVRYQREWAVEGDDPRVIEASKPQEDPDYCTTIYLDTFICESTDGGYHWSEPRKASRYLEHPADIVCMSDGTLVMVKGHKPFPHGPQVVWSRDEGKTWSKSFLALDMDPKGAAGQPSALALEDDTVLVSYDVYTWDENSTTNPPACRYQLWVVRFKLPMEV